MATGNTRAADTIAALYPYDVATGARSGEHPGKSFSSVGKTAYRCGAFFQAEDVTYDTIDELHAHLVRLAAEGQAFLVRGQRNPRIRDFLRRTANRRGKTPPGLQHADLRVLPLDLDRVPNVDGLDPRTDPVGAWRWLVGLLGPEFEDVRMSASWSSSCCFGIPEGHAPQHLDARLWLMLDTPIGASHAKRLMRFLGGRVSRHFSARGVRLEKTSARTGKTRPYHAVDWKISEVQQPIYVAAPAFLDGLADPLPLRGALLDGARGEASYGDLLTAMQEQSDDADVQDDGADEEKPTRPGNARAPRTSRGRLRIPGKVVPLAASARLVQAQRALLDEALAGRGTESYRAACVNLYHRRVALEQVALAVHRGGLVEGERDESCTRIASALVASLPLGWSQDRVRGEVRQLLSLVVDVEWLEVEWEGSKADGSILDRYRRASAGEKAAHGRDLRYAYGKDRLVAEWKPTYSEILELGLRSLCAAADAKAAVRDERRAEAGGLDREDWLAAARAMAPEAHRLRGTGMSLRGVAAALGLPVGKIQRLLALSADDVAAVPEAVAQQAPATVEAPVAVQAADPLERSIRYVMASTGAETPAEIAAALREPVGLVEFVMIGMELLPTTSSPGTGSGLVGVRMAA